MTMNYSDLSKLIQHRAGQAYSQRQAASKLPARKRQAAIDAANKLGAACEVAADILGGKESDWEKEERIKAIFIHAICD